MGDKGSSRINKNNLLALALLLFPLLILLFFLCAALNYYFWMIPGHLIITREMMLIKADESTSYLLQTLVPAGGNSRPLLNKKRIVCMVDLESDVCILDSPVRIATGTAGSLTTVYFTSSANESLPTHLRPYARKSDSLAMQRTSPVFLLPSAAGVSLPSCDALHQFPAVVFSTGGFAGNFFHDVSDVIIPLFLAAASLRPRRPHLVVTDFQPWWVDKYRLILGAISGEVLPVASNSTYVEPAVHCFPAAVVGLSYHGNLACNSTMPPGGVTIAEFRRFLRSSLSLYSPPLIPPSSSPEMVLISRRGPSRVILNEVEVVEAASEEGFDVTVATPAVISAAEDFARVVHQSAVMVGVHGAGLTNIVFMREGAVLVQVVPWGLDWAAAAYYGRPAVEMKLRYVEYHIAVGESSLAGLYSPEDPVIADPWGINRMGYNISKPIYTDGQNVTIDVTRFRETLRRVRRMLPPTK